MPSPAHGARLLCLPSILAVALPVASQVPPPDLQIAQATLALPESMREGAAVVGWSSPSDRVPLRDGSSGMICVADAPGDDRFRSECYPQSLHPLLARAFELQMEGLDESERGRILEGEVKSGTISLPLQPAMLHVLRASPDAFDPAASTIRGEVERFQILFTPFQTAAGMGLPTEPYGEGPWVAASGELFSHIAIPGKPAAKP